MESIIHHYTSIKNLALILNSGKLRFNRLDKVDDLKEIDGLPSGFGTYIFISCWTDEEQESIPLWKMYTENMRGVRISLPIKMFNEYLLKAGDYGDHGLAGDMFSPLTYEQTVTEKYWVINVFDNDSSFFKKVIYDDNYPQLYKKLFKTTKTGLAVTNLFSLGAFKKEIWQFQNECRFTLYIGPFLPLSHPLIKGSRKNQFDYFSEAFIKNIPNEIDYFDIDINPNVINNIYLRLGPLCDESDKIIVDSLLKKYTKNGRFEISRLSGSIRK